MRGPLPLQTRKFQIQDAAGRKVNVDATLAPLGGRWSVVALAITPSWDFPAPLTTTRMRKISTEVLRVEREVQAEWDERNVVAS